jgi:hypothetical protein
MTKRPKDGADLLTPTSRDDKAIVVINDAGPNAFQVKMSPTRLLICDPDAPLEPVAT